MTTDRQKAREQRRQELLRQRLQDLHEATTAMERCSAEFFLFRLVASRLRPADRDRVMDRVAQLLHDHRVTATQSQVHSLTSHRGSPTGSETSSAADGPAGPRKGSSLTRQLRDRITGH